MESSREQRSEKKAGVMREGLLTLRNIWSTALHPSNTKLLNIFLLLPDFEFRKTKNLEK
tara:strand:+ start:313 stop:489 length:177 start_codon:yes stop_codon:yes gene_type:complete